MKKPEMLEMQGPTKRRAPLLGSTRLTLFVIFLICTTNFILQRFNINFALVCMHRPYPIIVLDDIDDNDQSDFPRNESITNILVNISDTAHVESSSLILDDLTNPNPQQNNDSNWITSEPIDLHEPSLIEGCGSGMKRNKGYANITKGHFREFSWSKETQGWIISAFYYGLLLQIPCGWLVDRFGPKKLLILSHLCLSVLSLLSPLSARLGSEYFFVVRFLQGVFNGAAMPAINLLAGRWSSKIERSFCLGIAYAGFGLAAAVVYPCTAFICENFGWEYSFHFYGGTGLLWCAIAYLLIFEWPEDHPRIKFGELQFLNNQQCGVKREVIRTPWTAMLLSVPVWAMIITNMCVFAAFLTISAYLPTYIQDTYDMDLSENGLLSAIPYVVMLTIHFFAGFAFDWIRAKEVCSITVLRKSFNSIGMFGSAISIGAIGFLSVSCDKVAGALTLLTLSQTFLEFPLMGGYFYSIFDIAPKYAASMTSLTNTFGLMTGFIGPTIVSYLTSDGTKEQWILVFYVTAGTLAFGGFFYLIFGKCELLPWATDGSGNTVADGSGPLSRTSSKRVEQEMKQLKIRLITGESDVKGQRVAA